MVAGFTPTEASVEMDVTLSSVTNALAAMRPKATSFFDRDQA